MVHVFFAKSKVVVEKKLSLKQLVTGIYSGLQKCLFFSMFKLTGGPVSPDSPLTPSAP